MPSFLIVHSAVADGRIDDFLHPPVLDIGGALHAPLDWGDITMHVPAGDLPLTISVTRADGVIEGARITVRAPAGTGTRLTFVPPARPGGRAQLRIEGQWPADSSMHYYAARDGRVLTTMGPPADAPSPTPAQPSAASAPAAASPARVPASLSPAAAAGTGPGGFHPPTAASPPVGPAPGSTGSVPPHPTHFGEEQGAIVQPAVANHRPSEAPRHASNPSPSFGQRPPVERDVYGRELPERQPPPIATPADFDRLEREAHEAQARAYEAWQAQQPAMSDPAGRHDGAPRPVGLAATGADQARPDWYADPFRRADARWFDGRQWTSSVMRGGVRTRDQVG